MQVTILLSLPDKGKLDQFAQAIKKRPGQKLEYNLDCKYGGSRNSQLFTGPATAPFTMETHISFFTRTRRHLRRQP
jgi:hypothetical protein